MTALVLAAAFTLMEVGPDVAPTNRIVRRVDLAPIVIPRFADDLKALGTGGLTPVDGHSGSFAFLAVVESKTRRGVVAGWLTNEKASGVIASGFDGEGNVVLKPFAEYGRMEVPANVAVKKDVFAWGFFDDCRKGLEQYADLIAARYKISLPRQMAGYTTWYDDVHGYSHREGAGTAESARAFADAIVRHNLKAYGFDFYQIDDFWQSGRTDINGPARDFFHVNPKGPFPGGFKGTTRYLAERGIVPGLWIMPFGGLSREPFFADRQDIFATAAETTPGANANGGAKCDSVGHSLAQTAGRPFETAWGGTIIDLTKPSGLRYVSDLCQLITKDWGFRYIKFDGMWTGHGGDLLGGATWRDDHYDNIVRSDMTKTGVEAFRAGVRTMREASAPGTFLLACNSAQNPRSIAASYGLIDAMRIGGDNGPIDEFPDRYIKGPIAATPRYFYNGRVWYNDPDPIYVRDAVSLNRARLFASWGGISGLLYNFSDWLPNLSAERVNLLKRTMAPHGIKSCRPVDYFENLTSHVWEVGEGGCKVFGIFNWNTNKVLKVDYPAAYCGLDPEKTYFAFDFWRNKLLPPFSGRFSFEAPPDDCRVVAVHEAMDRPFVISTSRHVASPLLDVVEEHWDAEKRTLSGVSRVVPGERYELRIVRDGRLERHAFIPDRTPFAWNIQIPEDWPELVPETWSTNAPPPVAQIEAGRIAKEPDWPDKVVSEVVDVGGNPCFAVNGKPIYPLWGMAGVWASGRRGGCVRHSSAPLNVVTVGTDHRCWWPKGDEFNPAYFDSLAERHRRDSPGAYFIWDFSIYPPLEWREANPDEMARDEQGFVNMSRSHIEVNYSFASKKAFDDMERMLRKAIAYLESSPYANRIIGYRVNSGHTIEWLGWEPSRKDTILDFSSVAQKGFEAFAREHYPWVTDYSVPTLAERRALDEGGGFLWDQRKHARAIAYHDFYSTASADGLIRLCRAAKECVGGKKLVGTYYGYVMTLNGRGCNQMRAHFALKHLLEAKAVDFLVSPQSYDSQSRQPGTQICDMKPFATLQSHGIVPVIEDDTRTHNCVPVRNSQTPTEDMTVNIMLRNMGVSLCRCQPFYTVAIHSGSEFDFPRFADDAAALAGAGAYAVSKGVRRNAQIAVVASEEAVKSTPMYDGAVASESYVGTAIQTYDNEGKVKRHELLTGRKNSTWPYVQFYNETARIGAGVDFLLAEDIADNPGDYKLYIFQTCTKLTPALLRAAERLREKDCTILWTFAPGYTSDDGNSTENMKALTGMEFVPCPDVTDPGVTLDDGSKIGSLTYRAGSVPLAPIFAAADPDKVLGRYSNGAAGLAEKKTGRARTVFSGSYFIEVPLLQRLAREAGVHIFCDSWDIFEANESFISFHARNSGRKTIRLPRRADVYDVFGGRMVASGVQEFSFDAPLHSSWLFCYGDDVGELADGRRKMRLQ